MKGKQLVMFLLLGSTMFIPNLGFHGQNANLNLDGGFAGVQTDDPYGVKGSCGIDILFEDPPDTTENLLRELFKNPQQRGKDGQGVLVAVLDTGVSHAQFKQAFNLTPNSDVIFGQYDMVSSSQQAQIEPTSQGYEDIIDRIPCPNPMDSDRHPGHGTPVAALVLQVAPKAKLLSVRVCNKDGFCNYQTVKRGIDRAVEYAERKNLKLVVNMSFAVEDRDVERDSTLKEKIEKLASEKGILFAAAAGNRPIDRGDLDTIPRYPGGFDHQIHGLVSVSSIQMGISGGERVWFASPNSRNFNGERTVEKAYIGSRGFVYSLTRHNEAVGGIIFSGSSFASAQVAGLLAILRSENPTMSAEAIEKCLKDQAVVYTESPIIRKRFQLSTLNCS